MTEQEKQPSNNENTNETEAESSSSIPGTGDLDVEGALAALASLQELTGEPETEAESDDESSDVEVDSGTDDESSSVSEEVSISDDEVVASESDIPDIQEFERTSSDEVDSTTDDDSYDRESLPAYDSSFPRPPVSVLHRGQLASVVPALLLIGIGSYLTFIVTTSDEPLQSSVVLSILVGGAGAMLLAHWISSARWAIGSFFSGILLLLVGATSAYLVLPNNLSMANGYPLLVTATGMAFVITDVFSPSGRRIWLIGLILAIAGLAGVLTTTTLVNLNFISATGGLLPLALVLVIVLLIAPIISRRQ